MRQLNAGWFSGNGNRHHGILSASTIAAKYQTSRRNLLRAGERHNSN
jgi:hypothetical protein